jgi:IS5 family transposase
MPPQQMDLLAEKSIFDAMRPSHDPLAQLRTYINFEHFRSMLETAWLPANAKRPGGRPRWDAVMMFKVLLLQRLYNLSDEQAEYQLSDRSSFRRFLGLDAVSAVPDAKTIWRYREELVAEGTLEQLFAAFNQRLADQGIITRAGALVDASFVTVPKQRNTREENQQLKEGRTPPEWKNDAPRLAQKDRQARWTRKGPETFFGYKNHVKVDRTSKLIECYKVTAASANDGKLLPELVGPGDKEVHADCAYQTPQVREHLNKLEIRACLQRKGSRHVELTEAEKATNRFHAKTRVRVEHVFALIENCIGGSHLRYIGLKRITAAVGLVNLAHNFLRLGQLIRLGLAPGWTH